MFERVRPSIPLISTPIWQNRAVPGAKPTEPNRVKSSRHNKIQPNWQRRAQTAYLYCFQKVSRERASIFGKMCVSLCLFLSEFAELSSWDRRLRAAGVRRQGLAGGRLQGGAATRIEGCERRRELKMWSILTWNVPCFEWDIPPISGGTSPASLDSR